LCRANPTQGGEVVDLPRRHVATALTSAPSIFPARRTVVLPTKRLELCRDSARTCSWVVCPDSSQHRTLRLPHTSGSTDSLTQLQELCVGVLVVLLRGTRG